MRGRRWLAGMANTYTSPTHGASAVAPAITLFSTGGGSSAGIPAKTTGGSGAIGRDAPAGGYGPLDDNVVAVRVVYGARPPRRILKSFSLLREKKKNSANTS